MKYTEEHEWLRLDGDLIVVGITEHAATQLGDIVFVELPEVETMVAKMYEVGKGVSMADHFEIDDVIDPADTRRWITTAFRSMPPAGPGSGNAAFVDTW